MAAGGIQGLFARGFGRDGIEGLFARGFIIDTVPPTDPIGTTKLRLTSDEGGVEFDMYPTPGIGTQFTITKEQI